MTFACIGHWLNCICGKFVFLIYYAWESCNPTSKPCLIRVAHIHTMLGRVLTLPPNPVWSGLHTFIRATLLLCSLDVFMLAIFLRVRTPHARDPRMSSLPSLIYWHYIESQPITPIIILRLKTPENFQLCDGDTSFQVIITVPVYFHAHSKSFEIMRASFDIWLLHHGVNSRQGAIIQN